MGCNVCTRVSRNTCAEARGRLQVCADSLSYSPKSGYLTESELCWWPSNPSNPPASPCSQLWSYRHWYWEFEFGSACLSSSHFHWRRTIFPAGNRKVLKLKTQQWLRSSGGKLKITAHIGWVDFVLHRLFLEKSSEKRDWELEK